MTAIEIVRSLIPDIVGWITDTVQGGVTGAASLGIAGAVLTVSIAYLREKKSRSHDRRAALAAAVIQAAADKLQTRSFPPRDSADSSKSDAALMMSVLRLRFELSGWRNRSLRKYIDYTARRVRYGSPVPDAELLLEDLTNNMLVWARSPQRARLRLLRHRLRDTANQASKKVLARRKAESEKRARAI